MRILDQFPAIGFFRGAREFELRGIPKAAKVRSARLIITPVTADGDVGPALEVLQLGTGVGIDPDSPQRSTGVTKTRVGTGNTRWVEVNFHTRRTLAGVTGSDLTNATLQVEAGGLFLNVGDDGTVPANNGAFRLPGESAELPGLTIARIKVTADSPRAPDVSEMRLLAVASNLTLAFANQPPVWAYPGEVATEVETGELAEFVQSALAQAEDEGGFAIIPVTLSSDTTARLTIAAEIEFDTVSAALPGRLSEATLSYDYDGTSEAADDLLAVEVPVGSRIATRGTNVEITGGFENSEISHGPLFDRAPAAALAIAAGDSAAQPFFVSDAIATDAIDLHLSTSDRFARLEIDLRADLDGKPGSESLLATRAALNLDDTRHGAPRWVSAKLGQSVPLQAADPVTTKPRTWLLLQSLEGTLQWHGNPAPADAPQLHTSTDGGLSWRPARLEAASSGAEADFRLRRQSPTFKVPLQVEVGRDVDAVRLDLSAFQPLGRVDFALDGAELAGAMNDVLSKRTRDDCPRGEQLANGDFADRDSNDEIYFPASWTASGGSVRRVRVDAATETGLSSILLVIGDTEGPSRSLSQVLPVVAGCSYELTLHGFAFAPEAVVELIWRTGTCGVSRVDTLAPFLLSAASSPSLNFASVITGLASAPFTTALIPAARLRVVAPQDALQAEVRLLAPFSATLVVDQISLWANPQSVHNGDLLEVQRSGVEDQITLLGWTVAPAGTALTKELQIDITEGLPRLSNSDPQGRALALNQSVDASPGARFDAQFSGSSSVAPGGNPPALELSWRDTEGIEQGSPARVTIESGGSDNFRLQGVVPPAAATGELRLAIPSGATLAVADVSLEQLRIDRIPVSFLAEAPGRLTVRDFEVAFEPAPPPTPPEPDIGMCVPTPADTLPGDICECDSCAKPCQPKVRVTAPTRTLTRPAFTSNTANARIARAADRRRLAGNARLPATGALAIPVTMPIEISQPVIDVAEVGRVRQAVLAEIGITTVRQLALAKPAMLARRTRLEPELAEEIVANARRLLASTIDRGS